MVELSTAENDFRQPGGQLGKEDHDGQADNDRANHDRGDAEGAQRHQRRAQPVGQPGLGNRRGQAQAAAEAMKSVTEARGSAVRMLPVC